MDGRAKLSPQNARDRGRAVLGKLFRQRMQKKLALVRHEGRGERNFDAKF